MLAVVGVYAYKQINRYSNFKTNTHEQTLLKPPSFNIYICRAKQFDYFCHVISLFSGGVWVYLFSAGG